MKEILAIQLSINVPENFFKMEKNEYEGYKKYFNKLEKDKFGGINGLYFKK
jgi:hypothetical protein